MASVFYVKKMLEGLVYDVQLLLEKGDVKQAFVVIDKKVLQIKKMMEKDYFNIKF